MFRALAVIAPLALLAACDAEVNTDARSSEKVAMSADADGKVKFDLPFAKGQIKLPQAMLSNSEFDIDGVKMIPGGKLTGFNVDAGKDQPDKVNFTFNAPTSPEEVTRYYLGRFKAEGMTAAVVGDAIEGTTKDGSTFRIKLAPAGSGTSGAIELNTK